MKIITILNGLQKKTAHKAPINYLLVSNKSKLTEVQNRITKPKLSYPTAKRSRRRKHTPKPRHPYSN